MKSNLVNCTFIGFSILLLLHVLFTFCGFYGNDDINYARLSAELLHNNTLPISSTDHFPLRWITIWSAAFFFKLFGFTEPAMALFSYSCFVLTAFLISRFLKGSSLFLALATFILFFLNFTVVFYAHRLLPDAGICLFIFAAYFFYHQKLFYNKDNTGSALLFSSLLFLGVLTKETIILSAPLWFFLCIKDISVRRNIRFWGLAFLFFAILTLLYLWYFKITTGDWFFRYHVLNRNSLLSGGIPYAQQPGIITVKRLSYQLWNAFLLNGDMEYLIFAICAFIYRRTIFPDTAAQHVVISFLILLLSANFMSYTIDAYNPLLPDPRHFIFVIPFAVISGAYMIKAYFLNPRKYPLALLLFILADIWLICSSVEGTRYVYFIITFSLLLAFVFASSPYYRPAGKWLVLLGAGGMILNYVNDFIHPRYPYYFDQRDLVKSYFSNYTGSATVYCGDDMTAELNDYFLGFKNTDIRFVNIQRCKTLISDSSNQYLLINGGYDPLFRQQTDSLLLTDSKADLHCVKGNHTAFLYAVADTAMLHELKKIRSDK